MPEKRIFLFGDRVRARGRVVFLDTVFALEAFFGSRLVSFKNSFFVP